MSPDTTPIGGWPDGSDEFQVSVERLGRDLRESAKLLSPKEARFLVDAYYAMQRDRIRAAHQQRTLAEGGEPHNILGWLYDQRHTLEKQIAASLDVYSDSKPAGEWARSILGIGPIIAAGLLCHIDITKSPTVGHIWRFAGQDPSSNWLGKEKATKLVDGIEGSKRRGHMTRETIMAIARAADRSPAALFSQLIDEETGETDFTRATVIAAIAKRPWNGALKRLCFLIGESFVKVANRDSDIYGKVYKNRKEYEERKNAAGDYADQAAQALEEKNYGADTDARKHYEAGRLPPARIHMRAKRYAVKLFLAHLHHVMYELEFDELPPKPYVIEHLGHAHYIKPPNWRR